MMAGSESEAKMWVDAIQAANKAQVKSDIEAIGEGTELEWTTGISLQTLEANLAGVAVPASVTKVTLSISSRPARPGGDPRTLPCLVVPCRVLSFRVLPCLVVFLSCIVVSGC